MRIGIECLPSVTCQEWFLKMYRSSNRPFGLVYTWRRSFNSGSYRLRLRRIPPSALQGSGITLIYPKKYYSISEGVEGGRHPSCSGVNKPPLSPLRGGSFSIFAQTAPKFIHATSLFPDNAVVELKGRYCGLTRAKQVLKLSHPWMRD